MIAGINVLVGTVTAVKFVLTTATNNDIISSIAGDIIIPPIAVYFDIVTEEFGIREVEGIVTPITDDGDFSCYSCTINVFKATIDIKTLETNINITRTFGDDGICPSGSCIRNGVIALKLDQPPARLPET